MGVLESYFHREFSPDGVRLSQALNLSLCLLLGCPSHCFQTQF